MHAGKRLCKIALALSAFWMGGLEPARAFATDLSLAEAARQLSDLAWHGLQNHQPKSMVAPLLKQALQADPDSAWVHFLASQVAATDSEAQMHRAEALRLSPLAAKPERGLIEADFVREEASRTSKLEKLARQHPADPRVRTALGKALLEGGAVGRAALEFEKARRLDPGTAQIHAYLAECAVRLQDYRSARRHYRSALARLHPQAKAESLFGGSAMTHLSQDPESSPPPSILKRHRSISRSLEEVLIRLRSKKPH